MIPKIKSSPPFFSAVLLALLACGSARAEVFSIF